MTEHFNINNFYELAAEHKKELKKEEIDYFSLPVKGKKLEFEGVEFKLDYKITSHLDTLVDDVNVNDDGLVVIVGPEGAGKSYFASQLAYYCSQKLGCEFTINQVHFDGQHYINKSLESNNKTINFLDESRRALNKMRGNSKTNVEFMNYLSECRSQNQLHFILLPAFADLERYVAVHRAKLVLSVEKRRGPDGKLKRGLFNIWRSDKKTLLNMVWENKYKEFPRSMLVYKGRFENMLCINKNDYDNKKEEAKKERYLDKEESQTEEKVHNEELTRYTQINTYLSLNWTWKQIGERFEKSGDAMRKWYGRYKDGQSSMQ